MIVTNELRRLAQAAMHPVTKGRWMRLFGERTVYDRMEDGCRGIPVVSTPVSPPHPFEAACLDFIAAANPATISELLDRLEAAKKELVELRAKIAEMEKQEPVAWMLNCPTLGGDTGWILSWTQSGAGLCNRLSGEENEKKLYTRPGAQPAPSEQDAPVRKAWARFSHELHRSPDAPYPGMSEAFEQHFSQSFTDREWRAEAATWAAAWKAAKRHCAQGEEK